MFKNIYYIFTAVCVFYFSLSSASSAREYLDDDSPVSEYETVLDYDRPGLESENGNWQDFGCKWVNYDEDRVVFRVQRRAGLFKKIRVKVGNDKAYFINARIVFYDGFRKKFHIASNQSFPGQAVSVQFSDTPRQIKKIILKYDARMRPGDQTKICLSGKKVKRKPPVLTRRPPTADMSWKDLGCIKAPKTFHDDYIRIGSLKGNFRALRFTVHRSPAMIENLSVTFEGGWKQRIRVKGYISAGRTSKPYFFRKGGKLSVIDISSRSRSLFRSSRICFQGLRGVDQDYDKDAHRQADRREPYQNIPRSEEELLDDEQYLGENTPQKEEYEGGQRGEQAPDLDDYIGSLERSKRQNQKQKARKAEALRRAQEQKQKRKQARQKQLELAEEKRAQARKQLERQAAKQRAEQQKKALEKTTRPKDAQPAPPAPDKKTAEEQARQDDEAFRKAQEKADKAQADLELEARKKADEARIKAEKQAKEQAKERANQQARQAKEAQILAEKNARKAEAQAKLQRLETKRQLEKMAEEDRLAEIQKLAAKRLAEKSKVHSKKAEFPTSKISPDKVGWISYGCQNFGNKIEERYIPVGRMQGTFTKIRVRVSGNSLTLKKMYVVYGNGKSEPLIRYSSRVKIGDKTSDYTLSHRRRFISEVKLKAKARDRRNDKKSLVCLEAYR